MLGNATLRLWSKLPCEVQEKQNRLILQSETVWRFFLTTAIQGRPIRLGQPSWHSWFGRRRKITTLAVRRLWGGRVPLRKSPSGGRPWKICKLRRMVSPAFRRGYSNVVTSTLDQLSSLSKRQFGRLATHGVDASDVGTDHRIRHSFLLFALLFQHVCLSSQRHGQVCHLAGKEGVWRSTGDRLGRRGLLSQGLSSFAHSRSIHTGRPRERCT